MFNTLNSFKLLFVASTRYASTIIKIKKKVTKNYKNYKKIKKNHKMTCGGYCSHPLTILTVLAKRTKLKKIYQY